MRIMRNVLIVLVAIVAIVVIGVALTCNGNDNGDDGASNPTPELRIPVPGDADLEAAVNGILAAIMRKDGAGLRDYLGADLLSQTDAADLDRLGTCIPEGASLGVTDRALQMLGDVATATIEFEVTTVDGQTLDVTAFWNFDRDGGEWLLKELPSCPFDAP
ncbi:MAG: nuclear transport factor 2 family protein [Dehalococcoidia bacterium]